jgi:hypothetical protein
MPHSAVGTVMMAWKKNKVRAASVTISKGLRHLLEEQLENIDVNRVHSKLWSKLPQRQGDERLAAAARTVLEQGAAQEVVQKEIEIKLLYEMWKVVTMDDNSVSDSGEWKSVWDSESTIKGKVSGRTYVDWTPQMSTVDICGVQSSKAYNVRHSVAS